VTWIGRAVTTVIPPRPYQRIALTYDAIVLGAGHNALVLQAYLGRAGLRTLSLERRSQAGGGLSTMEDPRNPGFLHNPHAFFLRSVTSMPWFVDLELARHGASLVEPELNVSLLTGDDRVLEWWTDIERTIESFARFNVSDAGTLRRWHDEFVPIVSEILAWEACSPPLPADRRRELLTKSAAGRRLLEVSAASPLEFVATEFEDPVIQAGLLFFNGLREVDLRVKGFGHHIAALLASPSKAQMVRGGTAQLARALEAAVRESGGDIRTQTEPSRIMVEGGKAVGVITDSGEELRAGRFVVSSLNPQQTFISLIDHRHLPSDVVARASSFRYNLLAPLFALHLNLQEPLHYRAADRHPELEEAFMVIMGLDHVDQFTDIVSQHERGTLAPTVMWGASPTRFDESQAPGGAHTAFMWEKTPYALGGDPMSWDAHKDEHGDAMLELWRRHAPNLDSAVIDKFTRSPLDVERSLHNMTAGDLLVGAFTDGQTGFDRPFPGAGGYRAPGIDGLYLCGSSSHPGGNVTGLPGYNAAQVILADLGSPGEWAPVPIEERLAALGG
jgi:phytoene dehydrogenase-like protein